MIYRRPDQEIDNTRLTEVLASMVGEDATVRVVSAQVVGYHDACQTYQVSVIYEMRDTLVRTAVLIDLTTEFLLEQLGLS